MKNPIKNEKIAKPLVILEIANNHMGNVSHGLALIERLSGVTEEFRDFFDFGVKFQFRHLDTFIHESHKGSSLKYVKRFEETRLSDSEWKQLFTAVRDFDFKLLATPFDEVSVDVCRNVIP